MFVVVEVTTSWRLRHLTICDVAVSSKAYDDAPEYIQNLVNRYHPRRQLRSVNDILLTPNRNRTVKYGRRLMDTAAASLWNTLPIDIKNAQNIVSFKKMLKTQLF